MAIIRRKFRSRTLIIGVIVLLLVPGVSPVLADWEGKPSHDLSQGTAGYTIPIETPPGTNGVGPKLALSYNSNGGNDWMGMGWSLSGLGYVERLGPNYSPSPTYTANDTYRLSLNNANHKLVYTGVDPSGAAGNYFRTQTESFLRIWYDDATGAWIARDTNGNTYRFGSTSASRQENPGTSQVFRWFLDYSGDSHGLFWSVSYNKDTTGGDIYPQQIVYTQGPGLTCSPTNLGACRTVDFILTPRTSGDSPIIYRTGAKIVTDQLLLGIEVKMGGQRVKAYGLGGYAPNGLYAGGDYDFEGNTPNSYGGEYTLGKTYLTVLKEVDVAGADGEFPLMAQRFTYNTDEENNAKTIPPAFIQTGMNGDPVEGLGGLLAYPASTENCTYTVDLNSDRLPDVLVGQAGNWAYYPNIGNGAFGAKVGISNPPTVLPSLCPGTVEYQRYYTGATTQYMYYGSAWMASPHLANAVSWYFLGWDSCRGSCRNAYTDAEGWWIITEPVSAVREIITPVNNTAVMDVDGDGFPDILNSPGVGQWYWWRGLGNGQFADRLAIATGPSDIQLNDTSVRMADIDADGLVDIIQTPKISENINCFVGDTTWQVRVYRNQGRDSLGTLRFTSTAVVSPNLTMQIADPDAAPVPCDHPPVSPAANSLSFVDMNSDGLPDLVWFARGPSTIGSPPTPPYAVISGGVRHVWYYPNQGPAGTTGWSFAPKVRVSGELLINGTELMKATDRWVDMNGDGLPDLLVGVAGNYFYQALNYSTSSANPNGYFYNGLEFWDPMNSRVVLGNAPSVDLTRENYLNVGDMDGDGFPDVIQGQPGNYSYYSLNRSDSHQKLEGIRTPQRGIYTFNYQRLRDNGTVRWVLNSSTTDDALGQIATTNYAYSGALQTGWPHNEFRGYARVTVTDPPDHNGQRHTTTTTYHQDDAKKGRMNSVEMRSQSGALYNKTTYSYVTSTPTPGIDRVDLSSETVDTYDGGATAKQKRTDYANYDSYGNAASVTVSGSNISPQTTTKDFAYNTSAYLVNRASHAITTIGGAKAAESWFDYDGLANGAAPTQGDITRETHWNSAGPNAVNRYFYDAAGNRIGNLDPKGNTCAGTGYTNKTVYDSTYLTYPVSETNALCQVTGKEYWGVNTGLTPIAGAYVVPGYLASELDPNGVRSDSYWDTMARPYATVVPPDTAAAPTMTRYHEPWNTPQYMIEYKRKSASGGVMMNMISIDGFGRTIQTQSDSETSGGQQITQDTFYDLRGLSESVSVPYLAFAGAMRDPTQPHTTTLYDPVRRAIRITNPDGTYRTKAYAPYVVTDTDEKFYATTRTYDALDRLIQTSEPGNGGNTYYFYDILAFGWNFQYLLDAEGNITISGLDSLGRKLYRADPDLGIWNYLYDANGNLTTQIDAKSQQINFSYDKLNRLSTKTYPGGGQVRYDYDNPTSGAYRLGRLWKVTDSSGGATFTYDPRGRKTRIDKTVGPATYTTQYTYDSLDRVLTTTYPDNEVITHTYNNQGLLENLTSSHGVSYIANLDYNALGQVTSKTLGNGLITTYTYHPQHFRLTHLSTPGLQDLDYGFDDAGNVTTLTDTLKANTHSFGYDGLHRLTSASSGAAPTYSHGYSYSPTGKLYSGAGKTFSYLSAFRSPHPHMPVSDGNCNYDYDLNGNLTKRTCGATVRTYVWDYDNRLVQAKNGASVIQASTYDYNGQRVAKTEGATTVYTPFSHYRVAGGGATKYYFANGERIAERDNGNNVYYYHSDHLRSSNVVSDSAGAEVKATLFYPYGATRTETGTKPLVHQYTGQEKDAPTGLYYYGARYYDTGLMRFISPDPKSPNPIYPQSLNIYAYANNNPVKNADIGGKDCYTPQPGSRTCYTPQSDITAGVPAYRFTFELPSNAKNFPETLNLSTENYHIYNTPVFLPAITGAETTEMLINSPVFAGSSPATREGTPNTAGWFFGDNRVTSIIVTNEITGLPMMVNISCESHVLGCGYVARFGVDAEQDSVTGATAYNIGEGNGRVQSYSLLNDLISRIWEPVTWDAYDTWMGNDYSDDYDYYDDSYWDY